MDSPGSGDAGPPRTPQPLVLGRRPPAAISSGRLPTMRSRDLTLGGVKKVHHHNKQFSPGSIQISDSDSDDRYKCKATVPSLILQKTFTPNIIGRKSKEELKTDDGPRRERKDPERGRQRDGRGRGRGRPEVIQSHSIFEQGPAEMMAKRRSVYDDARDTLNSGPTPIINIKKEKRETEEETKEILRKLERDNFLDDPHLKSKAQSCPVQLPLAVSGWVFKQEFEEGTKMGLKTESNCEDAEPMNTESSGFAVTIKQEPPDVPEMKKAEPVFRPPSLPEPGLLPGLLEAWSQCKEEELLFMQLPDSLPGQPPTTDVRPTKMTEQSEDGQSMLLKTEGEPEESEEENSCCLRDLQEGLVGRILVRKSGKVQLVLGNVTLDMCLGTPCSFLQELVSVGTEGRRGDLSVLGHIKHKLVCSPDFQALLENRA